MAAEHAAAGLMESLFPRAAGDTSSLPPAPITNATKAAIQEVKQKILEARELIRERQASGTAGERSHTNDLVHQLKAQAQLNMRQAEETQHIKQQLRNSHETIASLSTQIQQYKTEKDSLTEQLKVEREQRIKLQKILQEIEQENKLYKQIVESLPAALSERAREVNQLLNHEQELKQICEQISSLHL